MKNHSYIEEVVVNNRQYYIVSFIVAFLFVVLSGLVYGQENKNVPSVTMSVKEATHRGVVRWFKVEITKGTIKKIEFEGEKGKESQQIETPMTKSMGISFRSAHPTVCVSNITNDKNYCVRVVTSFGTFVYRVTNDKSVKLIK